jgi:hypothetical protein
MNTELITEKKELVNTIRLRRNTFGTSDRDYPVTICSSLTAKGVPCKAIVIPGTNLCQKHSKKIESPIENKSHSLNDDIKLIREEINSLLENKSKNSISRIDSLRNQLGKLLSIQSQIDLRSQEFKFADDKINSFVTDFTTILKTRVKDKSVLDLIYSDLFSLSKRFSGLKALKVITGSTTSTVSITTPVNTTSTVSPKESPENNSKLESNPPGTVSPGLTEVETGNREDGNGKSESILTPSTPLTPSIPGVPSKNDIPPLSTVLNSNLVEASKTLNGTQLGVSHGS